MADELDHNFELLSAYVAGELSPGEQVALDELAAEEPVLFAQAQELKELLKQGRREASAVLCAELRRRVQDSASEDAVLLSAAAAGDASEAKAYLRQHPEAEQELRATRDFTSFLKQGRLTAKPELSGLLAAALRQKLPVGALPRPARAASASSRRDSHPSLRVYARPAHPWRTRILVGVGLAAAVLLLLMAGPVRRLFHPAELPAVVIGPVPQPAAEGNQSGSLAVTEGLREAPAPEPVEPARETAGAAEPPGVAAPTEEKTAAPPAAVANVPELRRDTPPPGKRASSTAMAEPRVAAQAAGAGAQQSVDGVAPVAVGSPPETHTAVAAMPSGVATTAQPDIPQVATTADGTGNTGTSTAGVNLTPTPTATLPIQTDPTITPVPGAAVAGAIRDGNIQVTAPDGTNSTLQARDVIASGSQIVTDRGRAALVLPGGGRLWLEHNTSVKLTLRCAALALVMVSGEIAYSGATGGTLSVTAGGVQVSGAHSADVRIQDKVLTATVFDRTATVSAKGKSVVISANSQAVAALDGTEAPRKVADNSGYAAWWQDLVLPGEGASNVLKIPTSESAPAKLQSKSSRRR